MLQLCAIAHSPAGAAGWLPMIHCLEAAGSAQGTAAPGCAADAGLVWGDVEACWNGAEGAALHIAAGAATAALVPPHQYVPWVTLGGPGSGTYCTENGCGGFLAAVCKAYTGVAPAACNGVEAPAVVGGAGLRGAVGGVCKK